MCIFLFSNPSSTQLSPDDLIDHKGEQMLEIFLPKFLTLLKAVEKRDPVRNTNLYWVR